MRNKIITISREFGSGGFYIGELVAKHLDIPFYDKELIDRIAEESGLVKSYIERLSEYAPSKSIFAYSFVGRSVTGESIEDYIMNIQRKVILDIAEEGPCVIVGRNADYVLKDRDDCLHAFIYADMDYRADRIVRLYGESEKAPVARLQEKDKRRKINYQHYTGRDWGKAENYDLCLNSGKLGEDACVDFIVHTVQNSK